MSLLTIVQAVSDAIGLPRPSVVMSSNDQSIRTMVSQSNRGGKIIAKSYLWQSMIREATWTTLAAELQGTLDTIAPGFDSIIHETEWLRSQFRPLAGPLSSQEWQRLKAYSSLGPYPNFRIWQNSIYCKPTPSAGVTAAFEYFSKYWCQSASGTGQSEWAADDDTGIISEELLTLDLIWRFKQAKGLAYDEDFRAFQIMLTDAQLKDGGKRTLYLDNNSTDYSPINSVVPPDGNWFH